MRLHQRWPTVKFCDRARTVSTELASGAAAEVDTIADKGAFATSSDPYCCLTRNQPPSGYNFVPRHICSCIVGAPKAMWRTMNITPPVLRRTQERDLALFHAHYDYDEIATLRLHEFLCRESRLPDGAGTDHSIRATQFDFQCRI